MYYAYWGKSSEHDYHLLVYHGVDACVVAQAWLDLNTAFVERLARDTNLSCDTLQGIIAFFSALHDVGKFSIAFQNLRPVLLKELQNRESKKIYDSKNNRHDQLGWVLWNRHLRKHLIGLLERDFVGGAKIRSRVESLLDVFAKVAFGHHGLPPKEKDLSSEVDAYFCNRDIDAAKLYMDDLRSMFLPHELLRTIVQWAEQPREKKKLAIENLKRCSWQLAGMIVLSDWIASGELFSSCAEKQPIEQYLQKVRSKSHGIFREVGLYGVTPSSIAGFAHLFPGYADYPTPLQAYCNEAELPKGPQLWILEDVTGSGKTEAACTLVSRMIKEGLATGAYVALPTMATSNAMYERMADVYHLFFSSGCRPSLVLSHGARHLSESFRRSYSDVAEVPQRDDIEDTSPRCSAWVADSTKKSLLADVGVGTLDQVLLGALRVRFQSLRSLGMGAKVLVVDEVHAYDPYMLRVFEKIVTHYANLGVPLILLSATLPHTILKRLCQAFHRGMETEAGIPEVPKNEYFPLITKVDRYGIQQTDIAPRKESIRTIPVVFLESTEDVYEQILSAHKAGKSVCWIRNTIKDIMEGYQTLKDKLPDKSFHIFHSRFTMADRLDIEKHVCELFGKNSTATQRSGQVLLASQVVEQSLDLDFDILISDLAPIDLMIQRVGRLHRHLRNAAGDRVSDLAEATREPPVFHVHAPPEPETPTDHWFSEYFPGASHVYPDTAQLWRTKEILKSERQIRLPDRARHLIEAVYGDNPLEVPEVFFGAENEASGKLAASRDHADFNAVVFDKGYCCDNQPWDPEERVPTREGDEQRIVYLARYRDGGLRPYHDEKRYGWDLSSIKIRADMIDGEVAYAEEIEKAIESLRSERWIDNKALFLVVVDEQRSWEMAGSAGKNSCTIQYDTTLGLQVSYTEK